MNDNINIKYTIYNKYTATIYKMNNTSKNNNISLVKY
jgi:hypothetical protein